MSLSMLTVNSETQMKILFVSKQLRQEFLIWTLDNLTDIKCGSISLIGSELQKQKQPAEAHLRESSARCEL